MTPTHCLELSPKGPFSLEPIRRMQCGFLQGTRACDASGSSVTVAFPKDGTFEPVAARLTLDPSKGLRAEVFGPSSPATVRPQLERMLGLDHDAQPFFRLLSKDPVLARMLEERPAFRPVVAASPYAMAGWLLLSHRTRMEQAAKVQARLCRASGDFVEVDGASAVAFPRPESFLSREGFEGIQPEKWRRLQAVAKAALDGKLEVSRLNAMPYEEAYEDLLEIRGIGPWTASGILIRGCGPTDVLPLLEPTLFGAVQAAYGLSRLPTRDELCERAEQWKPFRTWMSVFLISADFDGARRKALPLTSRRRSEKRPRASV